MYNNLIDMSYFPEVIQELIIYHYVDKEGKQSIKKVDKYIAIAKGEIIKGGDRHTINEEINYYKALKELIFDQAIISNSLFTK